MGFERHHTAWIAASLVTVACFVGATAYTQDRLARLDALSTTIENNAVPSIDYLSRAAVGLTRLNLLLQDAATPGTKRAAALAETHDTVAAVNDDITKYLQLPTLPGESALWTDLRTEVQRAVRLADAAADDLSDAAVSEEAQPPAAQVDVALNTAVRAVLATLDFDVKQARVLARDVRAVRSTTLREIVELDAVATLVAGIAVVLAFRATRRHDELLDEHNALLTARVTELDRFAGRVAHDVVSPLGTIGTALALLGRSCDDHERTYIDRSQRAMRRVQQLVDDLLTFARSGARPNPDSECSLETVLPASMADCSDAAADKGIELVADAPRQLRVRCAPGVITSIVQNLVRNGIKYMGDRPVRRITVRASARGDVARIEVEDTGPGIPPEIRSTLFQPFVRGPREEAGGTGLGLATVKRLVESHGGHVGVSTSSGKGSRFWVEMPLARSARTPVSAGGPERDT
jgi:signal transduction histidine kinase